MRGMANVTLPMKEIAQIEIPVPPIEAQIDFVEQYSTLEEKSNYLGVELKHQLDLVKQLRQAILREAMQGKLVPQDPNDEPASVLLEKIKAEKERLIKKKKIKKQKPLPSITEEEIPFEIPDNWVWCRLGELAINRDGERKPISQSERESREKIYDYYGASGIIDQIDGYTHNGKYVLIGEDGANLRAKSTPIAFIAEGKFWVNNHAHVLEFVDDITNYFMTYCLNIIDINSFITGGFQPKLSQGNLIQIEIPLPPLSEQQRIVAKLDELMGYCDELEASIKESQQQNELLLQQVLREALEPKVKEAAQ
jgi:type I restriction enzyme S subunit